MMRYSPKVTKTLLILIRWFYRGRAGGGGGGKPPPWKAITDITYQSIGYFYVGSSKLLLFTTFPPKHYNYLASIHTWRLKAQKRPRPPCSGTPFRRGKRKVGGLGVHPSRSSHHGAYLRDGLGSPPPVFLELLDALHSPRRGSLGAAHYVYRRGQHGAPAWRPEGADRRARTKNKTTPWWRCFAGVVLQGTGGRAGVEERNYMEEKEGCRKGLRKSR